MRKLKELGFYDWWNIVKHLAYCMAIAAAIILIPVFGFMTFTKLDTGETGFANIGAAIVVSGSMEPNIHIDDGVIFIKVEDGEYQEGDVVVYEKFMPDGESILVSHRVLEKQNEYFIVKGDANSLVDDPVSIKQIKGKIIIRIPKLGKLTSNHRLLLYVSLGIVGVLFLLDLILTLIQAHKEKENG